MTRPAEVRLVRPVRVAEFHALQWRNDDDNAALDWMVDHFGWRHGLAVSVLRRGQKVNGVTIYGRNGRRYTVTEGDWVVALGNNGSLRVCSDRTYKQDYREIGLDE